MLCYRFEVKVLVRFALGKLKAGDPRDPSQG